MTSSTETGFSDEEIDTFLRRHEVGLLSLAHENEPYALPIYYGYDTADRRFFLRVVLAPDSDKRRFLSSDPRVSFLVYENENHVHRSVVGTGTLNSIAKDDISVEHIQRFGGVNRPPFDSWEEPLSELDILLYHFSPDELLGTAF